VQSDDEPVFEDVDPASTFSDTVSLTQAAMDWVLSLSFVSQC
jgi:hypothetical protein